MIDFDSLRFTTTQQTTYHHLVKTAKRPIRHHAEPRPRGGQKSLGQRSRAGNIARLVRPSLKWGGRRPSLQDISDVRRAPEFIAAGEDEGALVVASVGVREGGKLVAEVDRHQQVLGAHGVAKRARQHVVGANETAIGACTMCLLLFRNLCVIDLKATDLGGAAPSTKCEVPR